ncbi:TRAP transporter small permease subunit [Neobacillus terrae]|uniref:TRAP transporter small permease subunit n=1 Tax=Neobacillus terrae TaxID=3034837 RepID=UPI003B75B991
MSRHVFSKSFSILEEVVLFTFIWANFLTLCKNGKEGNHIFVDLVVIGLEHV